MFWCGHKRVEIHAGSATYRFMKFRVDIVWAALKGLHLIPFGCEQRHQPSRDRRLARATGWRCYEKTAFHACKDTKYIANLCRKKDAK